MSGDEKPRPLLPERPLLPSRLVRDMEARSMILRWISRSLALCVLAVAALLVYGRWQ